MDGLEALNSEINSKFNFSESRGGLKNIFKIFSSKMLNSFIHVTPRFTSYILWKLFVTPRSREKSYRGIFGESKGQNFIFQHHRIRIFEFGEKSAKSVLLVHGWERNGSDFFKFVPVLLDAGFHVVAFDIPAHGGSSGKQTNAIEVAELIQKISVKFGAFTAVIGHSFGGFAAAKSLATYNEQGGTKLVTVGTPSALSHILDSYLKLLGVFSTAEEEFKQYIEKKFDFKILEFSMPVFISQIRSEVLVVHDLADHQVPFKSAEYILKHTKGVQILKTQNLGHNRILRDEDTIQKIVNFISDS